MTTEEQIITGAARMKLLIENWCPENLLHEGVPNTLMRAFLGATACCADQHRALQGIEPIRPLDSYPDPMVGFHDTPTGQKPADAVAARLKSLHVQTDLLLALKELVEVICVSERDVTIEDCDHAKVVIKRATQILKKYEPKTRTSRDQQ